MPNKPDKFGLKFWLMCEVNSKYCFNGFPYLGKDLEKAQTDMLQGEFVVNKLIEPLNGRGYHITADNFFTSKKLASSLLDKNTTYLGTMRKFKRELPSIVKEKILLHSTKFFENENCLLTYHQCKPNKSVVLLSTLHDTAYITQSVKFKPNSIITYNKTKVGVDSLDQMTRNYSTQYPTRRWPVQVWSNILN